MARLSTLDASFLRVESPAAHMHVGWLATLELADDAEGLSADAVRRRVAARLQHLPRFRQLVTTVPLAIGEPVWEDDPSFALERHVRELPGHGRLDHARLQRITDGFFSRPLDRSRPLWELLVVPRLRGHRAAILGKVHHAMVDGIAAVGLSLLLFDTRADADDPEPAPWHPAAGATPLRLAVDAFAEGAVGQIRVARRAAEPSRRPSEVRRVADTLRRAAFAMADEAIHPAPDSFLNVDITAERTLAVHRVALARLLDLRRTAGVTINDLVLAISAGALRGLALERGEEPTDLRAMVPVSVRCGGDSAHQGNRITCGFVPLPLSAERASERLGRVSAAMRALKAGSRLEGNAMLLSGLGLLPEPLKVAAARLAASSRLYNLTISNLPGPRVPLYMGGARVSAIYPVVPLPDRHALSIGVLTYDDHAHFAIYADPRSLARPGRLAAHLEDALVELEAGSAASPARAPAAVAG